MKNVKYESKELLEAAEATLTAELFSSDEPNLSNDNTTVLSHDRLRKIIKYYYLKNYSVIVCDETFENDANNEVFANNMLYILNMYYSLYGYEITSYTDISFEEDHLTIKLQNVDSRSMVG